MLALARYAYLQTLVKLHAQRLLSPTQLAQWIQLPLEKILLALQNQDLDTVIQPLRQAQLQLLPAGNMDSLFLSVLLNDAQCIIRPLVDVERDFFIYWLRRFELQNLKTILRGKSLRRTAEQIRATLIPVNHFAVLPIDDLLHTDDIVDIFIRLAHTPFAQIARHSRENFEQKSDIFTIETVINQHYFIGLNQRFNRLNKAEQQTLHPILGRMIDQLNLIWLLRYRLYYQLPASQTYFLLLSGGRYLTGEQLAQLAQIDNLAQLSELLPPKISRLIADKTALHQIEHSLEQNIIQVARNRLKNSEFSLSHAFAYLIIREKQLAQIHALLKGKLLDLTGLEIAFALGETS